MNSDILVKSPMDDEKYHRDKLQDFMDKRETSSNLDLHNYSKDINNSNTKAKRFFKTATHSLTEYSKYNVREIYFNMDSLNCKKTDEALGSPEMENVINILPVKSEQEVKGCAQDCDGDGQSYEDCQRISHQHQQDPHHQMNSCTTSHFNLHTKNGVQFRNINVHDSSHKNIAARNYSAEDFKPSCTDQQVNQRQQQQQQHRQRTHHHQQQQQEQEQKKQQQKQQGTYQHQQHQQHQQQQQQQQQRQHHPHKHHHQHQHQSSRQCRSFNGKSITNPSIPIIFRRTMTVAIVLLLGLLAPPTMASYDVCSDAENDLLLPCHPSIFDAANFGKLQVTLDPPDATCGTPSSTYQRLGDRSDTDYTCDAQSTTGDAHPLTNIVDSDRTSWWQSVSQTPGTTDLNINITLSFNKLFRFAGDVILTFNAGRPEKMVLEKSIDNGATWTPLQFYARNCGDFGDQVDVSAEVTKENPAVVICTNRNVELKSQPRPGGKVTLDLDDRFKLFMGPTLTDYATFYTALDTLMLDFLVFSDLRFRFIRPASDGRGNFKKYYYAVQDLNIMARCFCNLHASRCTNGDSGLTCNCQHNTQGINCQECLPLYNERPWKRGSYVPYNDGVANECKKCECNEHADSCTFDASYGRGVCNNCTHNTRGKHCEGCLQEFFPNTTTALSDPERCLACECNTLGVSDGNVVCRQEAVAPDPIGQCSCKDKVTGRQCGSCIPGFYGLLEDPDKGNCTACECNLDGTDGQSNRCAQSGGQCPCKDSTTGRQCDICKDGYFAFPKGNPQKGCQLCNCNEGGSTSLTCDKTTGKCSCKTGIEGDKCDRGASGSYVPSIDSLGGDPASGSDNCDVTSDRFTDGAPFDGTTFAQCDLSTTSATVTFGFAGGMIQAALQWPYYPTIRYTNKNSQPVTGKITVTLKGDTQQPLSPLSERLGQGISPGCPTGSPIQRDISLPTGTSAAIVLTDNPVVLDGRCKFDVTLTLNSLAPAEKRKRRRRQANQAQLVQLDSVSLLPALSTLDGTTSLALYSSADDQPSVLQSYKNCLQAVAVLTTRNGAMSQAPCDQILFAVVADIYGGASACGCDTEGSLFSSQCASLGGQCTCKSGVGGRACDRCHEGFFNLTSDGCQECAPLPCPTPSPPPTTAPPPTTTITTTTTIPIIPDDDDDNDDRLSPLYIVLIVAAVLLFLFAIIFCIYYRKTEKRRRKNVREGVRIMSNLGLGDPNSPVYSNDIHQPHYNWVSQKQGLDNPAFVSIPDLPNDNIDSEGSVFESKSPPPTPHGRSPSDYYIDSDDRSTLRTRHRNRDNNTNNNKSNNNKTSKIKTEKNREREIDEKYKLSPTQVKKSKAEKQRRQFEAERRELSNPDYIDINEFHSQPEDLERIPFNRDQSASVTDLYAVPNKKKSKAQTKPRSHSLGTDSNERHNEPPMHDWRPMEDLRMSDGFQSSDSFSESPKIIVSSPETLMTSFKPLPRKQTDSRKDIGRNLSSTSPSHSLPTAKVNGMPHRPQPQQQQQQQMQQQRQQPQQQQHQIQPQQQQQTQHQQQTKQPSIPNNTNIPSPATTPIPQKPKRKKLPSINPNNNNDDKNNIKNNIKNQNNKNSPNDKIPLERQSSRFNKIYPPPAMFGMINPIFIPDPDYSLHGDISEPMVYIPAPDYPLYAGYESFDEFNGSLV